MQLKNKIILVTGSSRGIGKNIVQQCLSEGATVIANHRTWEGEKLSKLSQYDGDLIQIIADVSSPYEVQDMTQQIKQKVGTIDGIVNNAGIISRSNDWRNMSIEDWMKIFNTNIIGIWNVIRFSHDLLSLGASIVNISSIYGLYPDPAALSYSVSKAGVISLTQALAKDLSPNIRVNVIAPGNTLTDMVPDFETLMKIEDKTLLKRSATTKEISDVAIFLLSDKSSYMTGCIIPVDGGYHII